MSSDIYREQAQRIEELERENKRLAAEVEQGEARWKKGEEELEELREGRGEAALAAEKGKEAEKLVSSVYYAQKVGQLLTGGIEIGSRVTQATAFASSITVFESDPPDIDPKPIRLH